jgi:hypothetical protein
MELAKISLPTRMEGWDIFFNSFFTDLVNWEEPWKEQP